MSAVFCLAEHALGLDVNIGGASMDSAYVITLLERHVVLAFGSWRVCNLAMNLLLQVLEIVLAE